jgi:hypothetical protein
MPLPLPGLIATRKRTRSTNITENNTDHQQASTSLAMLTANSIPSATLLSRPTNGLPLTAPPKRQRNNPPVAILPPPVLPRTNYSLRNRS